MVHECLFSFVVIVSLLLFILSRMWPEYVKDRIRSTYMYFGGSVMLTAASAVACFRSPLVMRAVGGNSWMVSLN